MVAANFIAVAARMSLVTFLGIYFVRKAGIDIATVGYNTEWSQELRLEESLREYVKASMVIEILQRSYDVSVPAYAGIRFQVWRPRFAP